MGGPTLRQSDDGIVETKSEDDLQDAQALEQLEQQRAAALEIQQVALEVQQVERDLKRKRADLEEIRPRKRRKRQAEAVLLDTGRLMTRVTSKTLINVRPMLYLSSYMPFLSGPTMRIQRGAGASVLLDSDHLLVLGGSDGTAEMLNLKNLSFSHGPCIRTPRRECAAVMLGSGRLLVIGGYDGEEYLNTTEVLDLVTNEFVPGPTMNARRAAPAVAMLKTGHLVVLGGKNAQGCLESTEVLDVHRAPLCFTFGPRMRTQRAGAAVARLDDSRLIVVGGHDSTRTHNTTELLHIIDRAQGPPGMVFTSGPLVGNPRSYFAVVVLNAGYIHIIGGHDGISCLNTTEVLNLTTMEVTCGPRMNARRRTCTAAMVSENEVLVLGGSNGRAEHYTTECISLAQYSFPLDRVPSKWDASNRVLQAC